MPAESKGLHVEKSEFELADDAKSYEASESNGKTFKPSKLIEDDVSSVKGLGNQPEVPPYPKSVFFIVSNEFCERFSYYGMRTVLVLFLTNSLLFDEDTATSIYHSFAMMCYFTPLFGAFIADAYWGKFKTIFYISIVYTIGMIVIAVTSVPILYDHPINDHPTLELRIVGPVVGLILIAFGTGGIKPCVSAFGGDQFGKGQEKYLQQFFSLFYMSINAGGLISSFISPIFRADVQCYGDDCYPLAFGAPAILMVVALLLFLAGRNNYKIYPPTENVFAKVIKCIWHAWTSSHKPAIGEKHWLYRAGDKFDKQFIEDVRAIFSVLVMFLPLPVFWALYEQQGFYTIKPDQMQVLDAAFVVGFIPLFEFGIYPLLKNLGIPLSPLKRMSAGMLLAGCSFISAGLVQQQLAVTLPQPPVSGQSSLVVSNLAPCQVNLTTPFLDSQQLSLGQSSDKVDVASGVFKAAASCGNFSWENSTLELESEQGHRLIIGAQYDMQGKPIGLTAIMAKEELEKPRSGDAEVRVMMSSLVPAMYNVSVVVSKEVKNDTSLSAYNLQTRITSDLFVADKLIEISDPESYKTWLAINSGEDEIIKLWVDLGEIEVKNGGGYDYLIFAKEDGTYGASLQNVIPSNTYPMLWQVPQYIFITTGEVLFSITGLAFAYSQSPLSMKSVMQSTWLLTIAGGNLIVIIIAEAKFVDDQAMEFFLFAGLIGFSSLIFMVLSYFYKYRTYERLHDDDDNDISEDKKGKYAYDNDIEKDNTSISAM